jgi:hypoxanthine-guanine phosphoribosyltransferase
MRSQTKEKIIDFVSKNGPVTPKSIIEHLELTAAAVFRHLNKLVGESILQKQGVPPKVFYSIARSSRINRDYALDPAAEPIINERFLRISPDGTLQSGKLAFVEWCITRNMDPVPASTEYLSIIRKFDSYKQDGLIDATSKVKQAHHTAYLDKLYYLDFYSIERFGKTKLGELILYSKQSQNTSLIQAVINDVKPRILRLLEEMQIDAVGFIPPTVKRTVQFMKELEHKLQLPVKIIKITKIKTPIIVPQKTLNKIEERVENARQSFAIEDQGKYQKILLIDDAVGSGSTLNEVARQIRDRQLCTGPIIGLSLVGSFNGFEVIKEI